MVNWHRPPSVWYSVLHPNVCFLFHLINFLLGRSNVACGWRSIFISRKSNICQVRYLLQLLSVVLCAANGRRVVWVVSWRPSRSVSGSFDDRRPSSLWTTIVVPTKIAWCVPSFSDTDYTQTCTRAPCGIEWWHLLDKSYILFKVYINQ